MTTTGDTQLTRIEKALGDLDSKVDPLIADHVRRSDIDALRREMSDMFRQADERYYTKRELDPVLRSLRGGIRGARNAFKEIKAAKDKELQRWLIQTSAAATVVYLLLVITHQYIK